MFTKSRIIKILALDELKKSDILFTALCLLLCAILFWVPTGFEGAKITRANPCKARIVAVDNNNIHQIGLIKTGEQKLTVSITNGPYKGMTLDTVNHFLGKLELDKFYRQGETVFAVLEVVNNEIRGVQVIDRYRINLELYILLIFILLLLIYAGWVGLKAIVSFIFTTLVIWKILLPGYLTYSSPLLFSLAIVTILTGVIIFLVAGLNKKGLVAFLGAFSGVLLTCLLAVGFGIFFKIPGEIKQYAETLLYTGFSQLNLSHIFLAGIFIASSGAVMDIAMDVAASMYEIVEKKPDIHRLELTISGFKVGRSVIGTMTTTLLLAYSGGYSTLLMVFIAQGVPVLNILNIQYVASEILHTMVGSFGLIAVAPLTALIGGLIFPRPRTP